MRPPRWSPSAGVAIALLLSGCGASKSDVGRSEQARFTSRADAVCARAERRGKALSRPQGTAESISFFASAHASVAQAEDELQAVAPPASRRAAYRRFLAAIAQEAPSLEELGQAVRKGDRSRYRAITERMAANTVNAQAGALGLSGCAETVQPSGG
jgi:hypothetical protein